MAKYVLAYQGGGMAETPEAQAAAMTQWTDWFGTLGAAVMVLSSGGTIDIYEAIEMG